MVPGGRSTGAQSNNTESFLEGLKRSFDVASLREVISDNSGVALENMIKQPDETFLIWAGIFFIVSVVMLAWPQKNKKLQQMAPVYKK